MEYTKDTLYSTSWLNSEYAEFLSEILERLKYYENKVLLTASEINVPQDVLKVYLNPTFIREEVIYLSENEIENIVSEIKSWVCLIEVVRENNLNLEAALIAGERIVGRYRLYGPENYRRYDEVRKRHFAYLDKIYGATGERIRLYGKRDIAVVRRVITAKMVEDLLLDSQNWITIGELSELINIPVKNIIKTYSKLRRQQVTLYPIIDINKFNEKSIITEQQMIEKIINIETKVNPTRNYLDEEIKESKVGMVSNPPNSILGKYRSKKGRKGQGHY